MDRGSRKLSGSKTRRKGAAHANLQARFVAAQNLHRARSPPNPPPMIPPAPHGHGSSLHVPSTSQHSRMQAPVLLPSGQRRGVHSPQPGCGGRRSCGATVPNSREEAREPLVRYSTLALCSEAAALNPGNFIYNLLSAEFPRLHRNDFSFAANGRHSRRGLSGMQPHSNQIRAQVGHRPEPVWVGHCSAATNLSGGSGGQPHVEVRQSTDGRRQSSQHW